MILGVTVPISYIMDESIHGNDWVGLKLLGDLVNVSDHDRVLIRSLTVGVIDRRSPRVKFSGSYFAIFCQKDSISLV